MGKKLHQGFGNKERILHRHMKSRPINYLMFTVQALILFPIVPQFHKDSISSELISLKLDKTLLN